MLCPFCLKQTEFIRKQEERGGNANQRGRVMEYMACPSCESEVPRMYINNYEACPPAIVSAVGFPNHGKSVYLSSLFRLMRSPELDRRWRGYVTWPVNQGSLDRIKAAIREIDDRRLPSATPRVFPTPTLMQVKNLPDTLDRTLIMYDTAGETFRDGNDIGQYADFVARAETVLFFVSLSDLSKENRPEELRDLLETYVMGVENLGTTRKTQSLCVVLTKADEYAEQFGSKWPFPETALFLPPGEEAYLRPNDVYAISRKLRNFFDSALNAEAFLTKADDFFSSVRFTYVSALGERPTLDNRLESDARHCRLLDPILYVMRGDAHAKQTPIGKIWEWLGR
ncbi:MAG: hypothetical protein KDB03_01490 [Planctomycetales bacterium]|nr:hypothetical protein [Planctomycetales bacterium]